MDESRYSKTTSAIWKLLGGVLQCCHMEVQVPLISLTRQSEILTVLSFMIIFQIATKPDRADGVVGIETQQPTPLPYITSRHNTPLSVYILLHLSHTTGSERY